MPEDDHPVDLLRRLIETKGTPALLSGVDSAGHIYSIHLHPASPRQGDRLVFLLVSEGRGPRQSLTLEFTHRALAEALPLLALIVQAHTDSPESFP